MRVTLEPTGETVEIEQGTLVQVSDFSGFENSVDRHFVVKLGDRFYCVMDGYDLEHGHSFQSWNFMRLIPQKKKRLMVQADFPAVVWIKKLDGDMFSAISWTKDGKLGIENAPGRSIEQMKRIGWKWAETHSPKEWRSFEIDD